jgi:hypothetical protein
MNRFAWDVNGAFWIGAIPACGQCDAPMLAPGTNRQVPIDTTGDLREWVTCPSCGCAWEANESGEAVDLTVPPAKVPAWGER